MKPVGTEYVDLAFSEVGDIKMGLSLKVILNKKSMKESSLGGEQETERKLASTESCRIQAWLP